MELTITKRYITRDAKKSKSRGKLRLFVGIYPPVFDEVDEMWKVPKIGEYFDFACEEIKVPQILKRWYGNVIPYGALTTLRLYQRDSA